MDTIPQHFRLVRSQPGTEPVPRHSRTTAQANDLAQIVSLIERYNARLRRMSFTERATNNLTSLHLHAKHDGSISIVHHDSATWASGIVPAAPSAPPRIRAPGWLPRPLNPASRAELRAYFLRKGGSKSEAWRRFPPADSAESAQMAKDLQRKAPAVDPMEKIIQAAARKRRQPVTDEFRAQIKREQEELQRILDEVVI